ncbi:helix-turn-helix domain-containing protein [Methylorubrum extorquens]|uniref:helix-turn-helix domain-containing protein n=1 Tax=Methylorubrum extorquens TaxID=408 RepID=UPI0035CCE6DC
MPRFAYRGPGSISRSRTTEVSAAIRDARLDLVLRRLASQAWDGESIASIARASGFRDGGVFSRAFRRRYGLSARAFRHLSRTG